MSMVCMRESHYIHGAGGVHKSMMVILASSSCVLRHRFEAGFGGSDHLQPAKLPWQAAAGLLLLIAATIS